MILPHSKLAAPITVILVGGTLAVTTYQIHQGRILDEEISRMNISRVLPPLADAELAGPTSTNADQSIHMLPSDEQILNTALASLRKGALAYSAPSKMRTNQSADVTARIATKDVPTAALQSGLSKPGQTVEVEATSVSAIMRMNLTSADFDITPLSTEEQPVAGTNPTTWEWQIVPKRSGSLQLHLAAVVELGNLKKDFIALDREISVHVDATYEIRRFIATNWQWIIATLTAIGGAAWKFLRDREKKAASTVPDEIAAAAPRKPRRNSPMR